MRLSLPPDFPSAGWQGSRVHAHVFPAAETETHILANQHWFQFHTEVLLTPADRRLASYTSYKHDYRAETRVRKEVTGVLYNNSLMFQNVTFNSPLR